MSLPGESAQPDRSAEMEEVLTSLSGSETLDLLGMTNLDLQAARNDSGLFETLRITHGLLGALRQNGVLGTFLSLPKEHQVNFIRWVGAIDSEDLRDGRLETFIVALKQSPLSEDPIDRSLEPRASGTSALRS